MTVIRFILICILGLAVFPGGMPLLRAYGDTLRIAGSSTMQPIVVEIAKIFTEKFIDHVLTDGQKVVAAHRFLPISGGSGP
ncbi:MAG: hypothetical protein HQL74_09390 [Magnetococcales bacterium]|nr:hypothetical protein [Magnetococcales bacterium]